MEKQSNPQKDIDNIQNEISFLKSIFVQKKKWYKIPSILISIFALLLSISSMVISYQQFQAQNIQNLKSELRQISQRLITINRENVELIDKTPNRVWFFSSIFSEENSLLVNQALEIIDKLPPTEIRAIEYYTISRALYNSHRLEEAIKYAQKSLDITYDIDAEITGHRWYAQLLFFSQKYEEGRREYRKALNAYNKYENGSMHVKIVSCLGTEYSWATSEANAHCFENANEHIKLAKNYMQQLPTTIIKNVYEKEITEMELSIKMALLGQSPKEGREEWTEVLKMLEKLIETNK